MDSQKSIYRRTIVLLFLCGIVAAVSTYFVYAFWGTQYAGIHVAGILAPIMAASKILSLTLIPLVWAQRKALTGDAA